MSPVREPAVAPQVAPARDMELGHLFRGYECSDEPAPLGTPTYCGIRKVTARGALPFGSALCVVCDAVWRAERGLPPSPAMTPKGD